jgi:hypothetical protein
MPQQNSALRPDYATWRVGARVVRDDGDERGTIVEADGEIKVKWDNGRTSYYRRRIPVNVRLEDE